MHRTLHDRERTLRGLARQDAIEFPALKVPTVTATAAMALGLVAAHRPHEVLLDVGSRRLRDARDERRAAPHNVGKPRALVRAGLGLDDIIVSLHLAQDLVSVNAVANGVRHLRCPLHVGERRGVHHLARRPLADRRQSLQLEVLALHPPLLDDDVALEVGIGVLIGAVGVVCRPADELVQLPDGPGPGVLGHADLHDAREVLVEELEELAVCVRVFIVATSQHDARVRQAQGRRRVSDTHRPPPTLRAYVVEHGDDEADANGALVDELELLQEQGIPRGGLGNQLQCRLCDGERIERRVLTCWSGGARRRRRRRSCFRTWEGLGSG
mmetsp:Transcript_32994/g.104412  ORF Transcript_32994/g.104412 Transcript_32994/m.104412 type:complete len:327 (+) Transcript_32994:568-1548(+)